MWSRCLLAALLCAAGLSACDSTPAPTQPSDEVQARLSPDQDVARGLATAMRDPGVRAVIRDALRASPFTEHKLVLQDWLRTPAGRQVAAAAAAAGFPKLPATADRLPRAQFYVPFRYDRETWTATPNFAVAANLNDGPPPYGWGPNGRVDDVELGMGANRTNALLVVQALEAINKRIRPQQRVFGQTIQDPDDGQVGGSLTIADAGGRVTRHVEFADLIKDGLQLDPFPACDPTVLVECEDDSVGSFGPGTYLTAIDNHTVCDNVCIGEGIELIFKSVSQFNPTEQASTQLTDVPTCGWPFDLGGDPCFGATWTGMHLASPYRVATAGWVELRTWEDDGWPNGDDAFYCGHFPTPLPECAQYSSQSWAPRVGYGFWSFRMCESLPWNCQHPTLADMQLFFEDSP